MRISRKVDKEPRDHDARERRYVPYDVPEVMLKPVTVLLAHWILVPGLQRVVWGPLFDRGEAARVLSQLPTTMRGASASEKAAGAVSTVGLEESRSVSANSMSCKDQKRKTKSVSR